MGDYFYDNFNTKLTPKEEEKYQAWVKKLSKKKGRDVSQDQYDYDMRGLWKHEGDNILQQGKHAHGPDTFKKPSHPSFSDESIYSGRSVDGITYKGGHWDRDSYMPSFEMMQNGTHDPGEMQRYFDKYEPGISLHIPYGPGVQAKPNLKTKYSKLLKGEKD